MAGARRAAASRSRARCKPPVARFASTIECGRCRAATRSLYRRLLEAGVVIREWSGSVLHAKVATVDGRRLLAGSFNLDPLSLANLETLVEVADPHLVAQGEAWIHDHFVRSRPMTSVAASTWLHRCLLDPLGRLVARLVDMLGVVIASRKRRKAWAKSAIVPGLQASVPRQPRSR